jgi:4-hydroxy-3-methylbut-2-en-1-yl diphosphate synthase IspG/GcpE
MKPKQKGPRIKLTRPVSISAIKKRNPGLLQYFAGRAPADYQNGVYLLPVVRIAVMGCIVNGIGEMTDADFGYVGGKPGHVHLYYKKDLVARDVPQAEAIDRLITLIKEKGLWKEQK